MPHIRWMPGYLPASSLTLGIPRGLLTLLCQLLLDRVVIILALCILENRGFPPLLFFSFGEQGLHVGIEPFSFCLEGGRILLFEIRRVVGRIASSRGRVIGKIICFLLDISRRLVCFHGVHHDSVLTQ